MELSCRQKEGSIVRKTFEEESRRVGFFYEKEKKKGGFNDAFMVLSLDSWTNGDTTARIMDI